MVPAVLVTLAPSVTVDGLPHRLVNSSRRWQECLTTFFQTYFFCPFHFSCLFSTKIQTSEVSLFKVFSTWKAPFSFLLSPRPSSGVRLPVPCSISGLRPPCLVNSVFFTFGHFSVCSRNTDLFFPSRSPFSFSVLTLAFPGSYVARLN